MIKARAYVEILRFLLVGCINTFIGLLAIFSLMYWVNADPIAANAMGYGIGIAISYSLNKSWTFQHKGSVRLTLLKYLGCATVCYSANIALLTALTSILDVNPYFAQLGGVMTYTVLMFLSCRWIVFPKNRTDNITHGNPQP